MNGATTTSTRRTAVLVGLLFLVATAVFLFDLIDLLQGAGTVAAAPGGLFELILPIWLLVRGFTEPADL